MLARSEVHVVNAALIAGKAKVDIHDLMARIHSKRNSIRYREYRQITADGLAFRLTLITRSPAERPIYQ
jgi:hypothetical protein